MTGDLALAAVLLGGGVACAVLAVSALFLLWTSFPRVGDAVSGTTSVLLCLVPVLVGSSAALVYAFTVVRP